MTATKQPSARVPAQTVGILGGGQLGCMLADAAIAEGLEPRIYADASSPAAVLFKNRLTEGSMNDERQLRAYFEVLQNTVVAFENEFLDCDLLERATQGLAIRFSPSLDTIRELQDKLTQKQLMQKLGLPTADFVAIYPPAGDLQAQLGDIQAQVAQAYEKFSGQVVFKWSRMGYDGKGVCLAEDSPAGREKALQFCLQSLNRGVAVYAEAKVAFKRELAIIACAGHATQLQTAAFATYPLVVSEQENGICKRVLGPATSLGVSKALEQQAQNSAQRLAAAMKLEGSFALELFETPDEKIAINEIAPRVHNSGHYTQDACGCSQFANHWRAILGLPLGSTQTTASFGMLNLLGPVGVDVALPRSQTELPFQPAQDPVRLHWYAKAKVCAWRKVGHLNATSDQAGATQELSRKLETYHSSWVADLNALAAHKGTLK